MADEASYSKVDRGVLLVTMPFSTVHLPSIQVGTLAGYLQAQRIPVDVYHAYLRCADLLGPKLYHALSSAIPEEPFFTHFLFPEHFLQNRGDIESYLKAVLRRFPDVTQVSLDTVLNALRTFNDELFQDFDLSRYALVGFTVTYDQLTASLYATRKIKQFRADVPVVFGGALCTGELGTSLLETFPEIDFVVSGEGEEALEELFRKLDNGGPLQDVPGLIWRDDGAVKLNAPGKILHPQNLPQPIYDDFFQRISRSSPALRDFVSVHAAIPLEGSRGCWWGRCTFCNLNLQYGRYKQKTVEKILGEVRDLTQKHRCHNIRFLDNVQRTKDFDALMQGLIDLDRDLNVFMEIRAGQLEKEDYALMSKAGVKVVQIGIEAISTSMLKKINKGVSVIDNVAAVKYCHEFGILPLYLLIVNYPNEEPRDLLETEENAMRLGSLLPPSAVAPLRLMHGSPIDREPGAFNVGEKTPTKNGQWRFPPNVQRTLLPFRTDYTCMDSREQDIQVWSKILSPWQQKGMKNLRLPSLYYQDAGDFLTITCRLHGEAKKTVLKGMDRELYLFCDRIRSLQDIANRFPKLPAEEVDVKLKCWVDKFWMFKEDNRFLSLAMRLSPNVSPKAYFADFKPFHETHLKCWDLPPKIAATNNQIERQSSGGSIRPTRKSSAWLQLMKSVNAWVRGGRTPAKSGRDGKAAQRDES